MCTFLYNSTITIVTLSHSLRKNVIMSHLRKFLALRDNYVASVTSSEDHPPEEQAEEADFLQVGRQMYSTIFCIHCLLKLRMRSKMTSFLKLNYHSITTSCYPFYLENSANQAKP